MTVGKSRALGLAILLGLFGLLVLAAWLGSRVPAPPARMGRQPDGGFLVSSGQRIEGGSIAFDGRPIDLAIHPREEFFAVLNKHEVFLGRRQGRPRRGRSVPLGLRDHGRVPRPGLVARRHAALRQHRPGLRPGFHLQGRPVEGRGPRSLVQPEGAGQPGPRRDGFNRDGRRLFVAAANRNAVVEVDLTDEPARPRVSRPDLPFEPRLYEDERTLIVSNWGGRPPEAR